VSASNATFGERPRREGARSVHETPPSHSWIGIDLSAGHGPRRMRALLPLLVVAAIAALGVAALRIDLIRVRYAVAAVMEEEEALLEVQRTLIVRRRQLRDPVELAVRARALGFRPSAEVLALPDPVVRDLRTDPGTPARPSVAAGPPIDKNRSRWR
jgi:hypothetical protein